MKKLIFIGGTMGVGKSTLAQSLMTKLPSAVYLDGDWCWYTKPWILNEETRKIVILNVEDMFQDFEEEQTMEEKDIGKEIEAKFDELFGPIDSSNNNG